MDIFARLQSNLDFRGQIFIKVHESKFHVIRSSGRRADTCGWTDRLTDRQQTYRERQTDRHRQTDRQRKTDTDRQTDRHTEKERQTDRQTQTDRHRQTDIQRKKDRQTQTDRQTDRRTDGANGRGEANRRFSRLCESVYKGARTELGPPLVRDSCGLRGNRGTTDF
jgi:hypothetical protein